MADGSTFDPESYFGVVRSPTGDIQSVSPDRFANPSDPTTISSLVSAFPELAKGAAKTVAKAVTDAVAPPAAAATTQPSDYSGLVDAAAQKYGVDPALANAIALHGEGFGKWTSPNARSPKGATGVMQIMPETGRVLNAGDLTDPERNIDAGVHYIKQLSDQFNGDPQLIAAAYNAGPKAVTDHGGVPPYKETQAYVQRVQAALGQDSGLPSQGALNAALAQKYGGAAPTADQDALPSQDKLDAALAAKYGGAQPGSPAQAPQAPPSALQEIGAGATEALTGIPDAIAGAFGAGPQSIAARAQSGMMANDPQLIALAKAHGLTGQQAAGQLTAQSGAGHTLNTALGSLNPENVPAPTLANRLERAAGAGLTNAIIPGGEAKSALGLAGNVARSALEGTAFGAGSQTASEIAPDGLKGVAGLAGGIGTALATHGVKALGAGAVKTGVPLRAAISRNAAERQAASVLSGASSNPKTFRTALSGTSHEILPRSEPTTFQATGDMGIGALERGAAAKNPELFKGRQADQNAARMSVLSKIQSGADAASLAKRATDRFQRIDTQTDAAVMAATREAQSHAEGIGGSATAQDRGAELRDRVTTAEAAARTRERALWSAIDPDGKLTGNVTGTVRAAKDIASELSPTAKPLSGEEAAIFEAAGGMKKLSPVRDLIDLRSRVSTAMREELIASGNSPTYARLSRLRGAIESNLRTTIRDKVEADTKSVEAGTMAKPMSAAAQLEQALQEAKGAGRQIAFGGREGSTRPEQPQPIGRPRVAGAEVPPGGQPGGAEGDQAVSGQPTYDEAAQQRLAAATAATRERARTFGLQPVSGAIAKNGAADLFKMPDGSVPGKFFHSGTAGFQHMQAAIKAGGPQALSILQDYAASDLKRAAMGPDGVIDPAKFQRWKNANADALRAFPPETQARFADAAKAGQAVADAGVARVEAIKAFKTSALGKVMQVSDSDGVARVVGSILRGPNAAADMRTLVSATKGDANAAAGLRQAVADHIAQTLVSNTEAGTSGVNILSADKFQSFMKANRSALSEVFTPKEMDTLDAIAADIHRSKRSENALKLAGSNTMQDKFASTPFAKPAAKGALDMLGAVLGSVVGEHYHVPEVIGAAVGGAITEGMQQWRAVGVNRVNDLITQALLHPAVARRLLEKFPSAGIARQRALDGLLNAVARGTGASQAVHTAQAPAAPERRSALQGVPLSQSAH